MSAEKRIARLAVRDREADVGEAYLRESAALACARLMELPEWERAGTVMLYWGVGAEPDTRPLLRAALAAGKRVGYPRCLPGGAMEARQVLSAEALSPGAWGIPAPGETAPLLPPEAFDLILVPGAAFDLRKNRLGRGGGYYDRYLPRTKALRVALARERLLWEAVPTEAHDLPMDLLVTEARSLR